MRLLQTILFISLFAFASAHAAVATPSELATGSDNLGATTTITSGSSTPTGDSLVVAVVYFRSVSTPTFSGFSSTFSTGGWTTAVSSALWGSNEVRVAIGWAVADSSPGSGTVTATTSSNFQAARIGVYEISSGYGTPMAQVASGGTSATHTAGTDFTEDFASAPASSSLLISGIAHSPNNTDTDPLTGWTALGTQFGGGNLIAMTAYDTGSTATSFGGTPLFSDQTAGVAVAAIEIPEAGGGGTAIPTTLRRRRD